MVPGENTAASDALRAYHEEFNTGQSEGTREVVLCVDDSPVDRTFVKSAVSKAIPGFLIEEAESYTHALERVKGDLAGRVAIVISDKVMKADGHGPDLAEAFRGKSSAAEVKADMENVPFILVSGNKGFGQKGFPEYQESVELVDVGLIDWFKAKPLSVESIREAVIDAIRMRWPEYEG